ncbi:MAG TPA: lipocalin-like domain-containing protein [Anaeromyxobacteraceae bacterium]|nr:lipocalin-like domain-containing protein [Anaeromyxobacteraceae bacterium]
MRSSTVAVLLAGFGASSSGLSGSVVPVTPRFTPAAPGFEWSFPRDHFSHPGYRTEWWYFTGKLEAKDVPGRAFGYQLTFFRVGVLEHKPPFDSPWASANLVMVHAAVSDLNAAGHPFADVIWRETPILATLSPFPQHPIAWALGPAGSAGRFRLDLEGDVFSLWAGAAAQGFSYRLSARPERPLVLEGPDGLSRKSKEEGYASLYYSFTRLLTEGTLEIGGRKFEVRGTSWMDHEFGSSQLAPSQVGWDWFGLRLSDGRDLMLYLMRRADGSLDDAKGTLVEPDGRVRFLDGQEFRVVATGHFTSPRTKAVYPAGWRIEVPSVGIALEVSPALADQEDRTSLALRLSYWEGLVEVRNGRGERAGDGYVELTGYGPKGRPPI